MKYIYKHYRECYTQGYYYVFSLPAGKGRSRYIKSSVCLESIIAFRNVYLKANFPYLWDNIKRKKVKGVKYNINRYKKLKPIPKPIPKPQIELPPINELPTGSKPISCDAYDGPYS